MTHCDAEVIHEATSESMIWRIFTDLDFSERKMDEQRKLLLDAAHATVPDLVESVENL